MSPVTKRPIRPLLVILAALSCGDMGQESQHAVEQLPGGGYRVTNTGSGTWTPDTRWVLEEDFTLGASDGEGPDVFGLITSLRVDADGAIYVLDYLSQQVRVFDASGEFDHAVGGKGRGPGELMGAQDLHLAPDGRFLVIDERTARYSLFSWDGTLSESHPRAVRGSSPFGGFTPDGRFVDWGSAFPDEGPDVVAGQTVLFEPFKLSSDFRPSDTLPSIEFRQEMIADGTIPQVFFAARLIGFQDDSGRIWFANSGEYEVFSRSLEGDTMLVLSLPANPVPVGEAERQVVRDRMASRPQMAAYYLKGLPTTKPVIVGMFGDDDGHLYVVPELAGVPAGTVLDVFRDTGEYLGRMDLPVPMWVPSSGPVAVATRDHLYYVIADEFDVPRIVQIRVIRVG